MKEVKQISKEREMLNNEGRTLPQKVVGLLPKQIVHDVQTNQFSAEELLQILAYGYYQDMLTNADGNEEYRGVEQVILQEHVMLENTIPIGISDAINTTLLQYARFYQMFAVEEYIEYHLGIITDNLHDDATI